MEPRLLEMNGIQKYFPGVHALDDVHLDLLSGEVHALLGENGAGKSTLIKVLGGIYAKDGGEIIINGQKAEINSVKDAERYGISIIHQEIVLVPEMTIADNIFLGKETGPAANIDRAGMLKKTQELLDSFGMGLSAGAKVSSLNIAQQQMVEIIRATFGEARIIVMDEPTSSLSDKEVDALFDTVKKLTAQGIGIIYISHRMSELDIIADRVSVYRDGKYVATKKVKETTTDELVALMVGREVGNYYNRTYNECKETVLEVRGLTNKNVKNVSFTLKKGEILGFAGLVGAGRTETMRAIFGIDPIESGEILIDGNRVEIHSTQDAMDAGIGLVPESRREEGIFPAMSIKFNETIKVLTEFIGGFRVNAQRENEIADKYMKELSVRAPGTYTLVGNLSGGNQQKVVIASWLATRPRILILDEPTRGIDIGAKTEIYAIMNELAKNGVSIIMVSSELPEIIGMSDRVIVMRSGEISGELERSEATQVNIMKNAVNI